MTESEKSVDLDEEALKRKERLANLKRKLNEDNKDPIPKFRSYRPVTEVLKENVIEDAKAGDIEKEVQDQLQAANVKPVIEELDISSLAPRKPDWDLNRDVSKKLEKLQRRTQKAIAELIIERLKKEQGNLADAVNSAAAISTND